MYIAWRRDAEASGGRTRRRSRQSGGELFSGFDTFGWGLKGLFKFCSMQCGAFQFRITVMVPPFRPTGKHSFEIIQNERCAFVLIPCSLVAGLVDCVFVHTHWTTHDVFTLHSNVSANAILFLNLEGKAYFYGLGRKHFVRDGFLEWWIPYEYI